MRRKLEDKNIRKIFRRGGSLGIILLAEIADSLNFCKGQKVVVKKQGKKIIISDWE